MKRTIIYSIQEADNGARLGPWLRGRGLPEHLLAQLKRTDDGLMLRRIPDMISDTRQMNPTPADITGDFLPASAGDILRHGDLVRIHWEEQADNSIEPVRIDFRIIYEDEDILVIDKPAGVPVHPAVGNHGNTLANGVAYYAASKGDSWVFRCINRLDRNSGGLVLLAKNAFAAAVLNRAMSARQIHRTYQALVLGHTPEEGTIQAPIARKPGSIIEREVNFDTGDPAVTHFRALNYGQVEGFGECTLLELHLDTGRTHQIRVHMSWLGYPLVGDGLYGKGGILAAEYRAGKAGHALHSVCLKFDHPITGQHMYLESESGFGKLLC